MGQIPQRPMPVRTDMWQPTDKILDNVIRRCLDDVEGSEGVAGGSTIMGGLMVVAVLGVVLMVAVGNAQAALIVPAVLGVGALAYMVSKADPERGPRGNTLGVVGGPGRLPAGYLVHADAWEAGMAEHVQYIPESQLQAAVHLCRQFPGTVDELLRFTGTIAAQVPATTHATPADVEKRAKDLIRVGAPILKDYLDKNPPQPLPDRAGNKKGKK